AVGRFIVAARAPASARPARVASRAATRRFGRLAHQRRARWRADGCASASAPVADRLTRRQAVTGRAAHRNHTPAGPGIVPAFSEKAVGSRLENANLDTLRLGARMPDARDFARVGKTVSAKRLLCRADRAQLTLHVRDVWLVAQLAAEPAHSIVQSRDRPDQQYAQNDNRADLVHACNHTNGALACQRWPSPRFSSTSTARSSTPST